MQEGRKELAVAQRSELFLNQEKNAVLFLT